MIGSMDSRRSTPRHRFARATLEATAVISAVAASTASAGSWFVSGTKLAKGATVAIAATAKVDESTILSAPSLGVEVTCSGATLDGKQAFLQGEANAGAEGLTFLGCSEIAEPTCTIGTSLVTNSLVASVETGTAPLDRIRFAPKAGKALAEITFMGSSCPLAGEQPINGQVVLDSKTGQNESATLPVEALGSVENNSLELDKQKACLTAGKALLALASGAKWAFH
jgi:hypothetical protein